MKIKTYHFERVEDKEVELFIPEVPFYCFQTGVRRSIRIVPITVNRANLKIIYKLEITCVYLSSECKIEKYTIYISNVESFLHMEEKSNEAKLVRMLLDEDYDERTEEQFNNDLNQAIKQITHV